MQRSHSLALSLLVAACGSSSSGTHPGMDGGSPGVDARTRTDAPSKSDAPSRSDGSSGRPDGNTSDTGMGGGRDTGSGRDAPAGDAHSPPATSRYIIGLGEYYCLAYDTMTHAAISVANGQPIAGAPANPIAAVGGAHDFAFIDSAGNVWMSGANSFGECGVGNMNAVTTPTQIMEDSAGNPFTNVAQIYMSGAALGWSSTAIKTDGTLWGWGDMTGGNTGDGTTGAEETKPVQIVFPAGTVIAKAAPGVAMIALDSTGQVWTWGAAGGAYFLAQNTMNPDYEHPHTITLPSKAVDIAGGSLVNYALLEDGSLYGWSYDPSYLCLGSVQPSDAPVLLNSKLNLPAKITKVASNSQATYVILADGTLWSWGDDACGEMGIGTELDYATYMAPYAWDQGTAEKLQQVPVQIAPGKNNFTDVFAGSPAYVFYTWAEDADNHLFSWGRNKGSVLGDGVEDADPVNGNLDSVYPNSWDRPWITEVDPFTLGPLVQASSPYCVDNPSGFPCNIYTIPVTAPPTCGAGANQSISGTSTTLAGTASGNGGSTVTYHVWTQMSGPSSAIITLNSGLTPTVSALVAGTYTFLLTATDNNWRTSTSTVNIVVQ
jgi:alpha-tubulin suppressor-like RCC1 family protein